MLNIIRPARLIATIAAISLSAAGCSHGAGNSQSQSKKQTANNNEEQSRQQKLAADQQAARDQLAKAKKAELQAQSALAKAQADAQHNQGEIATLQHELKAKEDQLAALSQPKARLAPNDLVPPKSSNNLPMFVNHPVTTGNDLANNLEHSFGSAVDDFRGSVVPDKDVNLRREARAAVRAETNANDNVSLPALREAAFQSSAIPANLLQKIESPDDPRIAVRFNDLITANSQPAILNAANDTVDELYAEPEISSVKLAELQLGVQRLAAHNLYNSDARTRVEFLQGLIDQRLRQDHRIEKIHSAFVIGLPIVALGALSGYGVPQKAYAKVEEEGFLGATGLRWFGSKIREGAATTGERASSLINRIRDLRTPQLTSVDIAKRSLIDGCRQDEAMVDQLGLTEVTRDDLSARPLWSQSQTPTLKYDIMKVVNGKDLGNDRVVVFAVRPRMGLIPRPLVQTREMTEREAYALTDAISESAAAHGEENLAVKDAETGAIYPTDIPAESMPELKPVTEASLREGGQKENAGQGFVDEHMQGFEPQHRTFAEASAEERVAPVTADELRQGRIIEGQEPKPALHSRVLNRVTELKDKAPSLGDIKAGAKGVLTATSESLSKAGSAAKSGLETTKSAVIDPAYRNFNRAAFATTTIGAGVAASAIFVPAYALGVRHGEDRQSVFLESLVPVDTLAKLNATRKVSAR